MPKPASAGARPALVNGLPYPHPTSIDVTTRMRRNTRTETPPRGDRPLELHRRGLRFRKNLSLRLPGRVVRPDVVFTRARLAVFIDGCFWHSCPIHGNQPRANTDYWRGKLAINVARDRAIDEAAHDIWLARTARMGARASRRCGRARARDTQRRPAQLSCDGLRREQQRLRRIESLELRRPLARRLVVPAAEAPRFRAAAVADAGCQTRHSRPGRSSGA